jgi:predicted HTH domain antitoxin
MRTVTLDEDLAALLEGEEPLEQTTREMLVMELFRRGTISSGKASQLLGLERLAFARRAAELGIPYFLMRKDDWAAEKATIDAWLQS